MANPAYHFSLASFFLSALKLGRRMQKVSFPSKDEFHKLKHLNGYRDSPGLEVGERSLGNNRDLKQHKESLWEQRSLEAERKRHLECQQKLEKNVRREITPTAGAT